MISTVFFLPGVQPLNGLKDLNDSYCCLLPRASRLVVNVLNRAQRLNGLNDLNAPYALSRSGASAGGVISNALAVQHVIENEPTRATSATNSSVLKDASADA